jgi:tetratricopeptide (TPR) repeat protein
MLQVATMPRGALLALTIAVAALLAWRVLEVGIGALAERDIARSESEASLRQRLARNPADALTLLRLALELEQRGKRDEAGAAMREAARLAPADPQSLLLVAGYFLRSGEDGPALATLRRAVDASPAEVGERIWPIFAAALDSGRHRGFFDTIARDNPSWWPEFFRHVCARATGAGAMQAVYAARVVAKVVTSDEWRCVIERLQRDGQWAGAYLVWLNGLPLGERQYVGYVFNGGFELPLSNLGFDWRIPVQSGAVVSAEPGAGVTGQRALSVSYDNQRYNGPPVYQNLVLVPGRYRMEGRTRSDLNAWLGLQWGLYCQDGSGREARQLARSEPFRASTPWREFHQDFAVPPDCPAQMLRLELANPKQGSDAPGNVAIRLKGNMNFDDIRVRIVD